MNDIIKIDGKEFPFNFGLNATREFVKETGIKTLNLQLQIISQLDYTFLAIYLGIKDGFRKQGKQLVLKIEDLVDLFENDPNSIADAIKVMAEQMKIIESKFSINKESKNVKSPKKN